MNRPGVITIDVSEFARLTDASENIPAQSEQLNRRAQEIKVWRLISAYFELSALTIEKAKLASSVNELHNQYKAHLKNVVIINIATGDNGQAIYDMMTAVTTMQRNSLSMLRAYADYQSLDATLERKNAYFFGFASLFVGLLSVVLGVIGVVLTVMI